MIKSVSIDTGVVNILLEWEEYVSADRQSANLSKNIIVKNSHEEESSILLKSLTFHKQPVSCKTEIIPNEIAQEISNILKYFNGINVVFNNNLIPWKTFSSFQSKVYSELLRLDYGSTISYKTLAEKCGFPNAFRAVGSAMAKNPLPLIIPCHRVIKSNGDYGNYSPSAEIKRFLIDFERGSTVF